MKHNQLGTQWTEATGYGHSRYAHSLAEFGTPLFLPQSGAWALQRNVGETNYQDALGCYPLLACRRWDALKDDLHQLRSNLVSFCAVIDPFGNYNEETLHDTFDHVLRFKEHYVVDLRAPMEGHVCAHHRRNARRALAQVQIEVTTTPLPWLEDWLALYDNIIQRHAVRDMRAFSRCSFMQQLSVPGIVAFRALCNDEVVGMLLWFEQGNVGYYHLGAYNQQGYATRASFALFWRAIEYFRSRSLEWLNLGAGAGATLVGEDGLTRFKQGWSTGTRPAYFCGRILDPEAYEYLTNAIGNRGTNYFPAYRQGEFCKKPNK